MNILMQHGKIKHICNLCDNTWITDTENPKKCTFCHSIKWNELRALHYGVIGQNLFKFTCLKCKGFWLSVLINHRNCKVCKIQIKSNNLQQEVIA